MKKAGSVFLVLVLALTLALGLCACNSEKGDEASGADYSVQAMLDYAQQLEKAGNSEAAMAVLELVAQKGGADYIENAHSEIRVIKEADMMAECEEILGNKEGSEQ